MMKRLWTEESKWVEPPPSTNQMKERLKVLGKEIESNPNLIREDLTAYRANVKEYSNILASLCD